jgi:hypothetical protein
MLHNCVGGWFPDFATKPFQPNGDMTDVPFSSFDPIFWLHHSNVERMHYAWLATHPVPDQLKYWPSNGKQAPNPEDYRDITNLPLWPFPPKAKLSYENLPWMKGKGGSISTSQASTMPEWVNNSEIDYHYDNATVVGVEKPPRIIDAATETEVHVVLSNISVRGSGILKAVVNIGGHETSLAPRAMFFAPSNTPCVACDHRRLTLGWDVIVPKLKASDTGPVALAVGGEVRAITAAIEVTSLEFNGLHLDANVAASWSLK